MYLGGDSSSPGSPRDDFMRHCDCTDFSCWLRLDAKAYSRYTPSLRTPSLKTAWPVGFPSGSE